MDSGTLQQLQAQYGPLTLGGSDSAPAQKKKRGGLAGFVTDTAKSIASPFEYLGRAAIVNPAREVAAQVSGNKVAAKNASLTSNKNLGLGDNGTNIGEATKRFLGNSAQALLTVAAPEVNSIKGGAAVGAGFGGSSALAQPDSTAESVINQTAVGGALGGGLSLAGKLFSKGSKRLGNSSTEMEGRAAGIGTGEKVTGRQVEPARQEELLKWGQSQGMPTGKARDMVSWASTKAKDITKQLDEVVKTVDKPIDDNTRLGFVNKFKEAINKDITLRNNPTAQKLTDEISTGLSEIDSVSRQVAERRNLDKALNFARNPNSPDPLLERVYGEARKILNKVPDELKAVNSDYNKIMAIKDGALGASGRLTRASEAGGGGNSVFSALTKGDTAQSVKSVAGRFGRNISEKAQGLSGNLPKSGILSSPANPLALAKGGAQPDAPTADTFEVPNFPTEIPTANDTQSNPSPFNSENIQRAIVADVAANGGKNIAALTSLYNTFGKAPKLSAAQQKSKDQVNGVANLADVLEQSYSKAGGGGGAKGFITQFATKVPGAASNAKGYESLRKANIAPLARAISGEVGVLTDADIARAEGLLPKLSDTEYEAQLKLANLRKLIDAKQKQFGDQSE